MTEPKEGFTPGISRIQDGYPLSSGEFVGTSKVGVQHNRYLPAVDSSHPGTNVGHTVTWPASQNITELTVVAMGGAEGRQDDAGFRYVVNAPDATTAQTWLADLTPALNQDVVFGASAVGVEKIIRHTSAITRVDFEATGGDVQIHVEAV